MGNIGQAVTRSSIEGGSKDTYSMSIMSGLRNIPLFG
jgi:hypothetical protein